MAGITFDSSNRSTILGRDVTVMQLSSAPNGGVSGTPVDVIGLFETMEISLKREFADTTGSADKAMTSRALRFGNGSVKLTGFNRGTKSKLAAIFASASHAIFSFTESATGDQYQLMTRCEDFSKSVGKDTTKDSITLTQEGVPYLGQAGATPTEIPLEA